MFLPLASTMSVFNCRAVEVDAEKTFTRSRQVQGWTEVDLGTGKQLGCTQQPISQSSCPKASPFRSYRITHLFGRFLYFSEETASDWGSKGTFPVWSLISWWRGAQGSHPCLCRAMRWAPQITSFPVVSHSSFAEAWHDSPRFSTAAEVLRLAAVFTQFLSFRTATPSVFLFLYYAISLHSIVEKLFLSSSWSFFPPSYGAQSSAGCCGRGCCAALFIHSFCWLQRLNGRAQRR